MFLRYSGCHGRDTTFLPPHLYRAPRHNSENACGKSCPSVTGALLSGSSTITKASLVKNSLSACRHIPQGTHFSSALSLPPATAIAVKCLSPSYRVKQRNAFGAASRSVGRIFDVATGVYPPGSRHNRRSHSKSRIGRVGVLACV